MIHWARIWQFVSNPAALWLLALLPIVWFVMLWGKKRRRRDLARLGSRAALLSLTAVRPWRRQLRSICFGIGLILLVVASAGPQWGRQQIETASGRDVVIVLDLSRSMLAADVLPNRLDRAREALLELARALQRRGGHRIGLVTYAGSARVACPLTPDYDHFSFVVANLIAPDPRLAPQPGQASGTRLGQALTLAVDLQTPDFRGQQDILLISDGDDPARDEEWKQGADQARSADIPVYTVGVGDPERGSTIPDADGQPLHHDGQVVRSRLREEVLKQIADETGGVYTPARTDLLPLPELFRKLIEPGPVRASAELAPTLRPRYPWFFGPAFALFALATLINDRPRPRRKKKEKKQMVETLARRRNGVGAQRKLAHATLAVGMLVLVSAGPRAASLDLVREANDAFAAEDYENAVRLYTEAEEHITDPGLVAFNKAAALYRLQRFTEAEEHYLRCQEQALGARRAHVLYNMGNAALRQGRPDEYEAYDRAIRAYEACLKLEDLDEPLRRDLETNLKLARALRARVKPRDPLTEPDPDKPEPDPKIGDQPKGKGKEPKERPSPKGKQKQRAKGDKGKEGASGSEKDNQAGAGDLPPIPDNEKIAPMEREEARARLQGWADRIIAERVRQQFKLAPKVENVPDW